MPERQLVVRIIGDEKSLVRSFNKSATAAKGFGSSMASLSRTAGLAAGAAGLGALAVAVRGGFKEFVEAQRVSAQTAAVLKSTGGVAGVTAKKVDGLSQALLRKTGVDDEAIKSGENLLLTFTNIRNAAGKGNDVFTQATRAALDLSVAFKKDLGSSAILVGKALNDPVKGLSALSRVGVQFTDSQKKTIAQLVATGHALEAQKIILAELRREVGGSAAAFGKTLPGQLQILREQVRNVEGSLVSGLAPSIEKVTGRLNAWLGDSRNVARIQRDVEAGAHVAADAAKGLADAFNTLKGPVGLVVQGLGGVKRTAEALAFLTIANKVSRLAGAFTGLATQERFASAQAQTLGTRLGNLPTKIVLGVTLATGVEGPLKKLFEEGLGADFSQVSKGAGVFNQKPGTRVTDNTGGVFIIGPDGKAYTPAQFAARFGKHGAASRNTSGVQRAIEQVAKANTPTKVTAVKVTSVPGLPSPAQISDTAAATAAAITKAGALVAAAANRNQGLQFRALGFNAQGGDIIPGVANLKKQLAQLTARLTASGGLTGKLKQQLAGIRKVLSGELGKATVESRQKIQELFQTIRDGFDSGAGNLTKRTSQTGKRIVDTSALTAGLGLSPDEIRAMRARLAKFTTAATFGSRTTQPTFAGSFGTIVLHHETKLNGRAIATDTTDFQIKRDRRNAMPRRGR